MATETDIEARREQDRQALHRVVDYFRAQGWDDDMLRVTYGDVADYGSSRRDLFEVVFTGDGLYVRIRSSVDTTATLGGDVRDGVATFTVGKWRQRTLTGEGNGFISIDGEKWEY